MDRMLAQLSLFAVLLVSAQAADLSINTLIATRVKIQNSATVFAGLGVTPTFADFSGRRHLSEVKPLRPSARHLQEGGVQNYAAPGTAPISTPPGFNNDIINTVIDPVGNSTTAGRKMLADAPKLTFYATLKKDLVTGVSRGVYVFNQDSYDFLSAVSKSGGDYQFLRAVLILPDDLSATVAPPYFVSNTGFVSSDPSKPILVKLDSKTAVNVVPNIAVRFDYKSTVAGYAPLYSLYLTSLSGDYPKGLPQADLEVTTLAPSIASAVDTVTERITSG